MKQLILLLALALGAQAFAADVPISGLPAASALGGTEAIPAVQSGATKKTTPAAIKTYVQGTTTGTGNTVLATSPTLNTPTFTAPVLGTPQSGNASNLTGTASAMAVGTATYATTAGSATTASTATHVTTNANLTGPITSSGNATAIAAQTGTGSTFVMQSSPTLNTPTLTTTTITGGVSLPNGTAIIGTAGTIGWTGGGFFMYGTNNGIIIGAGGTAYVALARSGLGVQLKNDGSFMWGAATPDTNNADTGISRNAAGRVEINNGAPCSTASNCRDLQLRHLIAGGTAPTVAGLCGTSPSITGADEASTVTVGTVAPTACTITFGTAYANAPVCNANAQTTTTALNIVTTTTTVIVSAAALTAGEKLYVQCRGN